MCGQCQTNEEVHRSALKSTVYSVGVAVASLNPALIPFFDRILHVFGICFGAH